MIAIASAELSLISLFAERHKSRQGGVEEPAEPDTLAFAQVADAVHAVIPVAGAHQRQAMFSNVQAAIQRAHAVFKDRRGLG